MTRLVHLLAIPVLLAATAPPGEVVYQGALSPGNFLPTYDHGYLAVYGDLDTVSLYGPDGAFLYKATAKVEGANGINLINPAPDTDGSMIATVAYFRGTVIRGGGLAFFDRTGVQIAFVDTGSEWQPTNACIAPDHTIWSLGWRDHSANESDYAVLRHFSRDGHLLGGFLPRSSFEQDPVGPVRGGWELRASANGHIGGMFYNSAILHLGEPRRAGQWIEVDSTGAIVRRLDLPVELIRASVRSFTASGALYSYGPSNGYALFDPASNTWRPVTGVPSRGLIGADGNDLLFFSSPSTITRYPAP